MEEREREKEREGGRRDEERRLVAAPNSSFIQSISVELINKEQQRKGAKRGKLCTIRLLLDLAPWLLILQTTATDFTNSFSYFSFAASLGGWCTVGKRWKWAKGSGFVYQR